MWLVSLGTHVWKGNPAPCKAPACALGACHLPNVESCQQREKVTLGSLCSWEDEYLTTVDEVGFFGVYFCLFVPIYF